MMRLPQTRGPRGRGPPLQEGHHRARPGAASSRTTSAIPPGGTKPQEATNHRNGTSGKTILPDDGSLAIDLRAAVPLLHGSAATIDRELQLVRPYLELMQMRMPDRVPYAMNVDPSALKVRCPPTTLLTLVENAVRHGIDPSEEGGRIDVDIARRGERCLIRVTDTGAGLHQSANGLGTGLTTLASGCT